MNSWSDESTRRNKEFIHRFVSLEIHFVLEAINAAGVACF